MRLLGPNTIGLVNLTDGIVLSASGALEMEELPAGQDRAGLAERRHPGLAAVARSGRGIGFSKLVATGNEADLDVADFIDHLLDDDATAVIALYLEALRKPGRFRARGAAGPRRMGKPIVAFKVGRSEAGGRAGRVAHRRAGRRRPDLRRPVPAGRRDPRRRPSPTCSTSRRAGTPAAGCAGGGSPS